MNALDWMRVYNGCAAAFSTVAMLMVTWKLWPQMEWYERFGRQGITAAFLGFSYGSFESLATHAPYGVRMFIATSAFTCTVIAFPIWVRKLPRRPFRIRKDKS